MNIAELREKNPVHWNKATALRVLALDAVAAAKSGHSGMPMGMADVATVLFEKHLKFDPKAPKWADRDRFVLSAGHGSMLIYGLLHLTGYEDVTLDQIKNFRQLGAITAGHPEYGHVSGVETTTGPLGQGISTAVGMAIAEQSMAARFGKKVVDHHTYVIAGDGCLMEGISQEAIGLAGKQKLGKLIVLWDDNGITIDGPVSISDETDQIKRFKASGWSVFECDGHDPESIDAAITAAKKSRLPSMIACKTHIAIGSALQDTNKGHGAITDAQMVADTRTAWGWDHGAFEIPADIRDQWTAIGARGAADRTAWEERMATLSASKQAEFARVVAGEPHKRLSAKIKALKKSISEDAPSVATRKASQNALDVINEIMPETLGGSADLTGSNNTLTADLGAFDADNRKGRHISYGIREHGMAAAMNGIQLHGGCKAYGGTFLVFADYMRGAMRLSALMQTPVTYVLTHDSIGVGEDGPTHQPVETVASLRAMPNLNVYRPADGVETAEAWELAMTSDKTPSVMALTRQNLPTVRTEHKVKNLTAQGAYVLAEAEGKRQAIILASGSEVSIAMDAKAILESEGIGTRVVSMPCWELFAQQDEAYRRKVLPGGPVRVGVEAALRFGWDQWLTGERGKAAKAGFVGMDGFGASAPAGDLFKHFGITAEAVVEKVKSLL